MLNNHYYLCAIGLCLLCASTSIFAQSEFGVRFAHYNRNFNNDKNDRTQTGLGFSLSHNWYFADNKMQLGATLFRSQRLANSGSAVEDLLGANKNRIRNFSQLGEVFIQVKPLTFLSLKVGRFRHKSLLLNSKTRLLASTFQGATIKCSLSNSLVLNAAHFTKWSRRANDTFKGFNTELTEPGSIKQVNILSLKHTTEYVKTHFEVLKAQGYLSKIGINIALNIPVQSTAIFDVNTGLFSSHDAGGLFIRGADSNLDSPRYGTQGKRLKHDGFGGYLQIGLTKNHNFLSNTLAITHSRFGQAWLEDNFASDHGTNPFPTSTMGPDLTNRHERIWLASYKARFNAGILNGLSSTISIANAYGAFNALGAQFGSGNESWSEIDLRYKPKALKRLSARLRYRDYKSLKTGQIAGVKGNRDELRFTVDYQFDF